MQLFLEFFTSYKIIYFIKICYFIFKTMSFTRIISRKLISQLNRVNKVYVINNAQLISNLTWKAYERGDGQYDRGSKSREDLFKYIVILPVFVCASIDYAECDEFDQDKCIYLLILFFLYISGLKLRLISF